MSKRNRRQFLEDSMFATAAAVAATSPNALFAADDQQSRSPNEKLGVAVVGVRGRGNSHLGAFAGRKDTEVLYVCDVDRDVGGRRAEQVAKRRLILSKIAKGEELEIDDEEYYEAMKQRAQASGESSVDRFLADIDKRGLEETYKENILLDKVVDWLAENNEFEVVAPKD